MSTNQRVQYKPTPELQNVLNTLTPHLNNSMGFHADSFKLLSYSTYPENANKFTLYVEGADKKYKMEIQQELGKDNKYYMKVLKMFEIITK